MRALLEALYDDDSSVRSCAAESLGQVGMSNETVVNTLLEALLEIDERVRQSAAASLDRWGAGDVTVIALLKALHKGDYEVRRRAAASLGQLEIKNSIQICRVLVGLNRCLHDPYWLMPQDGLISIRQLLEGRSMPGYLWVPLRIQRARRLRRKRITFVFNIITLMVLIGLAATWLLDVLNPNGFPMRFLVISVAIVAFVAAVAQVLGRTLRDLWEHS
jgi:HEAT repeats